MAKNIVVRGRYYDQASNDFLTVISMEDIITVVYDKDGDIDYWDIEEGKEYMSQYLIPANDTALSAERALEVKVKKLHDDAIVPAYRTLGAAGFDLHIVEDVVIPANGVKAIPKLSRKEHFHNYESDTLRMFDINDFDFVLTNDNFAVLGTGLAFEIPVGYELEIRSRSGLAFKHRVTAYNGTIDSDYRGEVKLLIINDGPEDIVLKKGDRVAQGILKQVEQANFTVAEELSETERGDGGFGHTGISK